jgi:serine/threonine protein kinase
MPSPTGKHERVEKSAPAPQRGPPRMIQELDQAFELQSPLPEIGQPVIGPCIRDTSIHVVSHGSIECTSREAFLINGIKKPTRAYILDPPSQRINDTKSKSFPSCVYSAYCLHRAREGGVFQETSPYTVERVTIKCFSKAVLYSLQARGKLFDDPYKDILRMQSLGDNVHVLGCIEASEDDSFVYVITPYCEHSLADLIPWQEPGAESEENARTIFSQILESIRYLYTHGVCHGNISVHNVMVYQGRVVLADLGASFRIPATKLTKPPTKRFGNATFQAPEIFQNLPFDPHACDVWSSVVVMFHLLTGRSLYHIPYPDDTFFRYFCLAQGFSRRDGNRLAAQVMAELEGTIEEAPLRAFAVACEALSRDLLDMLAGVLQVDLKLRWTLDEIEMCTWMTSTPV